MNSQLKLPCLLLICFCLQMACRGYAEDYSSLFASKPILIRFEGTTLREKKPIKGIIINQKNIEHLMKLLKDIPHQKRNFKGKFSTEYELKLSLFFEDKKPKSLYIIADCAILLESSSEYLEYNYDSFKPVLNLIDGE